MPNVHPVKASPLDDDAFRLLAFPFTGPIPMPGTKGVDLDAQWFSPETDIKPDWLPFRPTDWHHGADGTLRRTVLGKALDLGRRDGPGREPDEDGWWVTVWLERGQRRLSLIRDLAERGAQLFGSSETLPGLATVKARSGPDAGSVVPWRPNLPGEIVTWPYWRQTLSTSPQNTHSVLRPLKATLDEIEAAGERPGPGFWADVEDALRSLGTDLLPHSGAGDARGKAGHADPRRAALLDALASFEQAADRLSAALR